MLLEDRIFCHSKIRQCHIKTGGHNRIHIFISTKPDLWPEKQKLRMKQMFTTSPSLGHSNAPVRSVVLWYVVQDLLACFAWIITVSPGGTACFRIQYSSGGWQAELTGSEHGLDGRQWWGAGFLFFPRVWQPNDGRLHRPRNRQWHAKNKRRTFNRGAQMGIRLFIIRNSVGFTVFIASLIIALKFQYERSAGLPSLGAVIIV